MPWRRLLCPVRDDVLEQQNFKRDCAEGVKEDESTQYLCISEYIVQSTVWHDWTNYIHLNVDEPIANFASSNRRYVVQQSGYL